MSNLPPGWRNLTLSEVAEGGLFSDGDWVETKDQDPRGSVRLTQLADVGIGTFRDRSNRWLREDQAATIGCTFLQPRDLLVARMPDPIGRSCLVPETIGRAVTAVDVAILRVNRRDIDPRFAMWAINAPAFHASVQRLQSGTTRKRISRRKLATLTLPVPPIVEQRHIIAILEDHLSRLDAARDLLNQETKLRAIPNLTLLRLLGAVDTSLDEVLIAPLANGRSVQSRAGGFPVLRLTALVDGQIDLTQRKDGAWSRESATPFLVRHGDFLISRGNGSRRLVGRGGLVARPDEVAYPDTLVRARVDPNRVLPAYLSIVWNSPVVRQQIESVARTTAGIFKVNQKDLSQIRLPVPSLQQQTRIVDRVGPAAEAAHRLRGELEGARAQSRHLRRSLFAAAFSGRLIGHASDMDPVEEMAEA